MPISSQEPCPDPRLASTADSRSVNALYAGAMQSDARLLMRYVARRANRALPVQYTPAGAPVAMAVPDALLRRPEQVAESPADMAALAAFIDGLSRQAAPATVSTIRFTAAFLGSSIDDHEPPRKIFDEVARLRLIARWGLRVLALFLGATLLLLAHDDSGRRILAQLQQEQLLIGDIYKQLGDAAAAGPAQGARPRSAAAAADPPVIACQPAKDDQTGQAVPTRPPATPAEAQLCGRLADTDFKMALTYASIRDWNCETEIINSFGLRYLRPPLHWMVPALLPDGAVCGNALQPGDAPAAGGATANAATVTASATNAPVANTTAANATAASAAAASRDPSPDDQLATELRLGPSIALYTGFVLPLCLAFIGGSAYALRHIDRKVEEWTLEPRDTVHMLVRVLLATTLGGLVGAIWSPDQDVQISGVSLSLAALAFFVGYSVEVVLSVIEAMVDGVAGKLRAPPPAPLMAPLPIALPVAPPAQAAAPPAPAAAARQPQTAA